MAKHRTRVGLHARNEVYFPDQDYELVRRARIETMKMLSFVDPSAYKRIRQENPNIEFIVRLYDERIQPDSRPSSAEFVNKLVPTINQLRPYATKFEIHNEPNHASRAEGWGPSDDDAHAFRSWYLRVLGALKKACPWAKFGFPGLAINHPHRDLAWLAICQDAVQSSDWLGCHCYWQYDNMFSEDWGARFRAYHQRFPNKPIEITEFADSTPDRSRDEIAFQYIRYYQELNKYTYLGSASAFIASSPDPAWVHFVWRKEGGEMLPVIDAVGNMERKPVDVKPTPVPPPTPRERQFPETGKTVKGKFLEFFEQYSLDVCGYPITDEFKENGLPSQYFQRVGLEQSKLGKIELKLVGTEAWTSRDRIADLEGQVEELSLPTTTTGPVKPAIEDIVDQLPKDATQRYPRRNLDDIHQLVIHHTATAASVTPKRLADYQVRTQRKPGTIYHFVVAADGKIYQTNRLQTVSDHAFDRNTTSLGICFPGNFTKEVPPPAQLEAAGRLCAWLLSVLELPVNSIVGVSEFAETQSPGHQWLKGQRWKDQLLKQVEAAQEPGDKTQPSLRGPAVAQPEPQQGTQAQQQGGIPMPNIYYLVNQLPKHSTKRYQARPLCDIHTIVVHHSAAPPTVGPEPIAKYHISKLDWPGIGYHFLVGVDGTLYQTNTLETVSYHAVQANATGLGICFLGNFMKDVPPARQLKAGAHLIAWLMQELELSIDVVQGHKEVLSTACPGEQWLQGKRWKELLRQAIKKVQDEAGQMPPVPGPGAKPVYHYMLFWAHNGTWAKRDWINAQNYIAAFRPSAGFSPHDAVAAEYVTIVGGPLGISKADEESLRAAGCEIDRIAGEDEEDTRRMLDELVQQNKRFQNLDG
ncbi:MAG: N-acetylmuramoyl-L-alanine amidase [Anaerolineae bacterium]